MTLKWHELRSGCEYIILHDKKIHNKPFYKGIFIERREIKGSRPVSKRTIGHFIDRYENVTMWYSLFSVNGVNTCFFESDIYYDFKKIRDNANQARKNMEYRAFNIILKGLINEEFEWS
jgi:hypothetical protein